jgi:hypothetical protein
MKALKAVTHILTAPIRFIKSFAAHFKDIVTVKKQTAAATEQIVALEALIKNLFPLDPAV